jgi:hypothetical protein
LNVVELFFLLIGLAGLVSEFLVDELAFLLIGSTNDLLLIIAIDDIGDGIEEPVLEVEGLVWDFLKTVF